MSMQMLASAVRNIVVLVAVWTLWPPGSAQAVVMIEQPLLTLAPDGVESTLDLGNQLAGVESAERFFLPQTAELLSLAWWGSYDPDAPPATDNFTVRLFADAGGIPAASPIAEYSGIGGSAAAVTGVFDSFGSQIYGYTMTAPAGLTLTGGATYYLSLVNVLDLTTEPNWYWAQGENSDGLNYERSVPDPLGLGPNPGAGAWGIGAGEFDLAYSIQLEPAGIPAPATLLLVAPFALLLRRRASV